MPVCVSILVLPVLRELLVVFQPVLLERVLVLAVFVAPSAVFDLFALLFFSSDSISASIFFQEFQFF
jgi:hypothetical protein